MNKIKKIFPIDSFENPNFYHILLLITVITIGIFLRIKIYLFNQPILQDECLLATNLIDKNYIDFFKPLKELQVAPPFFMIISKFFYELTKNSHDYKIISLSLRIFPLFCSIIAIPIFSILVYKTYKNHSITLLTTAIITFNTAAINYAQEFKQYSCEMLFTILIIYIFYSIDIKTIQPKKLILISTFLSITPWFASTALIMLPIGYLFIIIELIKKRYFDKNKILILFLPMFTSITLFYFGYYQEVRKTHYDFMEYFFTKNILSFFTTANFNELFFYKTQKLIHTPCNNVLSLYIFLIINATILFFQKNKITYFVIASIILTIMLSFFKQYPYELRLILFLLPLYSILYSQTALFFDKNKIFKYILSIAILIFSIFQTAIPSQDIILTKPHFSQLANFLEKENNNKISIIVFERTPFIHAYYYTKVMNINADIINIKEKPESRITKFGEIMQKSDKGKYLALIFEPLRKNSTGSYTKKYLNLIKSNKNLRIIDNHTDTIYKMLNVIYIKFEKI